LVLILSFAIFQDKEVQDFRVVHIMITPRLLAKLDLFSSLNQEDLTRLASKAADIRLAPGAWLAREGERLGFLVILKGRLAVRKQINGKELHIAEMTAGDFFGEVNALLDLPAASSLCALTHCRIAAFDRQQLKELMQSSTPCGDFIRKVLQTRLEDGPRHAMELSSVRVQVSGSRNDPSLGQILTFLKSNRIAYEWGDAPDGDDGPFAHAVPLLTIDGIHVAQPLSERAVAEAFGVSTEPQHRRYDLLIVGGGPAGLAAAVYGASEGLRVLLVEQNAMGGQAGSSSRIENYLGFPGGISGEELAERAVRQAEKFGAELVLTRRVLRLQADVSGSYRVSLDGGVSLVASSVLVTTGVRWRTLEAEGIAALLGRGVSYGVAGIEPVNLSGKRVFIIGGGNSAGQAAVALSNYAASVTLLVRGATLEATMSQYLIEQLRCKTNVRIETESRLESVAGHGVLRTICTTHCGKTSTRRKADALYILIGADASTEWLPSNLQRNDDGFIQTGRDVTPRSGEDPGRLPFPLETSLPGVFCAGDVRHGSIKRVASAVGEGSMVIASIHQYLALQQETSRVPVSTTDGTLRTSHLNSSLQ
jgi:thioredoxin reductase (NADPH)